MIESHLQLAIEAALDAGKAIMEVYNTEFNAEIKNDKSPLTEADIRANDIINIFLKPTNIPIISEENKQIDYGIRKNWKTCWIVDPVDGTKEFVKRNGEFTVNIALVTDGKPQIGVIYAPVTKEIYAAVVINKTAFKSKLKSHTSSINEVLELAIPLKPKESNASALELVGSRSHMNQETLNFIETLKKEDKQVEVVSKGSSLKFCLIAEGLADIYPRFAPTMEWDTAAGQAICNAVGVKVISQQTNKSLNYNKENLLNPWFIVSN